MQSGSIVRQATAKARRSVLLALAGAGVIVTVFLWQHMDRAAKEHTILDCLVEAYQLTADILLSDERLTMSALMAAETGKSSWSERYAKNVPVIDRAIKRAMEIAPPELSAKFDSDTRWANDELVDMEKNALKAAEEGDIEIARKILDSDTYRKNKETLTLGTTKFVEGMIGNLKSELEKADTHAALVFSLALVFGAIGGVTLWVLLVRNLNKSEAAFLEIENRVRHLAGHDALTGLANRHSFREKLATKLKSATDSGTHFAILLMDIKGLKKINDLKGHMIGDLVLTEVAQRFSSILGERGHTARFGDDEFVCLLETSDKNEAIALAEEFVTSLECPISDDDNSVKAGASVGISFFPSDSGQDEDLLRKADLALRKSKTDVTSNVVQYHSSMDEELEERTRLEAELREGLRSGQVVPYFQPIVDLETEQVECFEILSRWEHPVRGLIPPDDFIPLAESSGIIGDLTLNVLRSACKTVKALPGDFSIALNIAPQQIQDDWLVQGVLGVITETGFPPERLEVELVETALVSDLAAAKRIISSLKNLGIRVALDDFGTGYSSLSYLSELPFDKIKIDRSFISNMLQREENIKIVNAIIGLGRSLGFHTVAEGVETEMDADFLRKIGCPSAQGYYYAKPTPAKELGAVLKKLEPAREHREIA